MQILFTRRGTLTCRVIRFLTWSQWSHVAVVIGDRVYEAMAATGVRCTTWQAALDGVTRHDLLSAGGADPVLAEAFLRAQVGKPYDWTAICGMFMRRDWQRDDRWECTELAAAALLAGGLQPFRKPMNRVVPEDLWTSPLLGAVES